MAKRADSESKRTTSMDDARLDRVAGLIRQKRTGPEVEEILAAVKAGLITEDEAIGAMERDFAGSARYRQDREKPMGFLEGGPAVAPSDPEQDFIRAEVMAALKKAIDNLSPRRAECVRLYHFEGLTQRAIAEHLGISQASVSEHLIAARKRIYQAMQGELVKAPSQAVVNITRKSTEFFTDMMRTPIAREIRSARPLLPFELWSRHNEGARWTRYHVYRPVVKNRLPEYLADCFDEPPVVGAFASPRTARKSSPATGIEEEDR